MRFSLELSERPYDRDFILCYGVAKSDVGMHWLAYRLPGEDGYFLLLLAPSAGTQAKRPPKNIVFVIDTSGSMRGKKIEQAKRALEYALDTLAPSDRFGLVSFASIPRTMADRLLPASKGNIERAKRFVGQLSAVGGTALNDALVQAAKMAREAASGDRPSYILLFTDGRPTVGERDEGRIVKNVTNADTLTGGGRASRLFLLGVGYDVNARLLDLLAEHNGGATQYVRPEEDLEAAISSLVSKIGNPVLTDLRINFKGCQVRDVQPARLPDLFRGDQLSLIGRYMRPGRLRVRLVGKIAGRERKTWNWQVDLPKRCEENEVLPHLWATRQIGYLLDQIRLHGESDELKEEIVRLALKFGIVTPYTSYLVSEEEKRIAASDRAGWRAAVARGGPGMAGGQPAFEAPPQAAAVWRRGYGGTGSGKAAIDAAKAVAKMRQATAVAPAPSQATATVKHIAGKTFYFDATSGYWIDADYTDGLKEVRVKYLSDVYLRLCQLRPDIARWLAVGEKVKVRIGSIGLVVGEEVKENLQVEQIPTLGR